jgi:hypothetical protein
MFFVGGPSAVLGAAVPWAATTWLLRISLGMCTENGNKLATYMMKTGAAKEQETVNILPEHHFNARISAASQHL